MSSDKEALNKLKEYCILVTGGAGFIGSNLVKELSNIAVKELIVIDDFSLKRIAGEQRGLNVLKDVSNFKMINMDAANYKSMYNFIRKANIDIIFDLAILPLPLSLKKPKEVFEKNVKIASVLCELLRKDLYKVLVHFSSSEVYGSGIYIPIDEEHPLRPSTSYGASKAAQDLLILSYYLTYGIDVRIIRPFNNVGIGQNDFSYSAVIPRTIRRILSGKPPEIFGDGLQTRDFIYVSDTCKAAIEIAFRDELKGDVVNIGSGKETRIIDVITKICNIMGYNGKILFRQSRPGDVRRHCAGIKKAKKLLNFNPKVSLDEALKIVITWYKSLVRREAN